MSTEVWAHETEQVRAVVREMLDRRLTEEPVEAGVVVALPRCAGDLQNAAPGVA